MNSLCMYVAICILITKAFILADSNSTFDRYSRRGSEESRRSQESRRRSSTSISARKNLNFGSSIHGESNSENQRKSKRRYTEGGYSSMQRFTNERIFHSPVSSFELKIFSPINEERRSEAESINITMSSPVIKRRRNSL